MSFGKWTLFVQIRPVFAAAQDQIRQRSDWEVVQLLQLGWVDSAEHSLDSSG